jgi:hypothetical protein
VTGDGDERVARSWIFRFTLHASRQSARDGPGLACDVWPGGYARAKATECRRLAYDGVDPIEARRNERTKAALEAAKSLAFKECAEQYLAAHRVAGAMPNTPRNGAPPSALMLIR